MTRGYLRYKQRLKSPVTHFSQTADAARALCAVKTENIATELPTVFPAHADGSTTA